MSVGAPVQLSASNAPRRMVGSRVKNNIATVDATGLVRDIAAGTVTITATDAVNTTACSRVSAQMVSVAANRLGGTAADLTILASGAAAPYAWRVSDAVVVSISSSGLLTGQTAGTVVVSATMPAACAAAATLSP